MIMIQDDPLPTGADKPLRITGDPQKVQVSYGGALSLHTMVSTHFKTFLGAALLIRTSALQQARELVVKLIRDKDQGDFRVGRADFGSKMGGSTLDVSDALLSLFKYYSNDFSSQLKMPAFHPGGCAQICCWNHHWQERRDDQKDSERCGRQDSIQTRLDAEIRPLFLDILR